MNIKRGEIWLADLNPIRGSEQAGIRPVLIFQNNAINSYTTTVLAIPFTSNLRRAALPSSVRVAVGEGGLTVDSVALCHQLRVLDTSRLTRRLGNLEAKTMVAIEQAVLFTMGITLGPNFIN
ncbi:MAG: type II toxin-antitoxin system PemK/MazF family toxin [Caldilinea sp. CFX5]|nr:type II toxin-antitoxin system PemK/MazF family toxin [Caldilinea sp. CFX5]